jgi:membrane-associated phospholipid phosphatase
MHLSTAPQAPARPPQPRLLLPGTLRAAGAAMLAGCAATAVLAGCLAGHGRPGWLDSAADPRILAALSRFPVLLTWLPRFGTLLPAALMTAALALAFVATRRWSGAILAVVAVPAASGLTEYVLKPHVGAFLGQSFPSGHATVMFALAAICAILLAGPARNRPPGAFGPPGALRLPGAFGLPGALRLLLALLALLLAVAVAAVMIAIRAHTLTDVVAGAAVGTGVVLACALSLDLVASRARRGPAARPESAG